MAEPLDEAALASVADSLPGWQVQDGSLVRDVEAPTFPAAIEWVVMIAAAAEDLDNAAREER